MPKKFQRAIIYLMIIVLVLGTILAGAASIF